MSYADEREYSKVQRAMLITQYILAHGSITFCKAMEITGGSKHQVYRLLVDMERVLPVYREDGARVLLEDK